MAGTIELERSINSAKNEKVWKVTNNDPEAKVEINNKEYANGTYKSKLVDNIDDGTTVVSSSSITTNVKSGVQENNSTAVKGDQKKDVKTEKAVSKNEKDTRSFWQKHPVLRVLLIVFLCLLLVGLLMIAAYHITKAVQGHNRDNKIDDVKDASETLKTSTKDVADTVTKLKDAGFSETDLESIAEGKFDKTSLTGDKLKAYELYADKYKTAVSDLTSSGLDLAKMASEYNVTDLGEDGSNLIDAINADYSKQSPGSHGPFRIVGNSLAAAGVAGVIGTGVTSLIVNSNDKSNETETTGQTVDNNKAEQNTKTITKTTTTVTK